MTLTTTRSKVPHIDSSSRPRSQFSPFRSVNNNFQDIYNISFFHQVTLLTNSNIFFPGLTFYATTGLCQGLNRDLNRNKVVKSYQVA